MKKKKLVVIGGGFAGVNIIKQILNSPITRKAFEVTLIDKNDHHLFTPALVGAIGSKKEISEIFDATTIKFDKIFNEKEMTIIKGEVSNINFEKKLINLKPGYGRKKPTEYDYLVISAGSETNFRDIPGAKEHSIGCKNFRDVIEIKSKIEKVFQTKPKRKEATISVIGAGDTGCGLIGALVEVTNDMARKYGHPLNTVKFKLVQRGDKILSASSKWIRSKVQSRLNKIGIETFLKSEIESVKEDSIVLKDGTVIASDIAIWTAGIKPNSLINDFGEPLKVSAQLRLDNHKSVYVLGDVACFGNVSKIGKITAQSAIHQASYVVESLKNKLLDRKTKKYQPIKSYTVVEIGRNSTYADLGSLKASGYLADVIRRYIFVRYFTSLMSFGFALSWLKKYRAL